MGQQSWALPQPSGAAVTTQTRSHSLPTATEFARLTEFACCHEQETYLYHSLPYCRPYIHERKSRSLGDALEGNTLINTGIKINFRSECLHIALCSETLFLASLARVYFLSGS